jgi:DNA-directed RNA polymerase subunit RPC12/RpoP
MRTNRERRVFFLETTTSCAYFWGMDDELRAELLRRMERDQAARRDEESGRFPEVDAENLPWLKRLVAERGWPGSSLVGADGANAMWLLVQHATADPAFMRHCLDLLTAAVEAGEASITDQAYLTDRVLLHEGEQQVYGTQLTRRGGKWVPDNLRGPDGVDERRAAVGMRPLAEYLARFVGPTVAARINCSDCDAWTPFEPPDLDESVAVTCTGCGREMIITGPPQRVPHPTQPSRTAWVPCPGCGGQVPFEKPDDFSQPVIVVCPECGRETTIRPKH